MLRRVGEGGLIVDTIRNGQKAHTTGTYTRVTAEWGKRPRGRNYFKRMAMLDHQQDRKLYGILKSLMQ